LEWLQHHRHEDLKNFIANTAAVRDEVDKLLRADQAKTLEKVNEIGDILLKLLGQTEQFKGLAIAFAPDAQLSEQAILILRQFVDSGKEKLIYSNFGSQGVLLQVMYGSMVEFYEGQERFIEDDLQSLISLRLVNVEQTSNGYLLGMTRNAVKFIESLPKT
jgi:hypothetical protein